VSDYTMYIQENTK